MKKFCELDGVTYSIGELIEMIDNPEIVYHVIGTWAFRTMTTREEIELCDLLVEELKKN